MDNKPEDAATVNTCNMGTGPVSGTEIGSVVLKGGPLCCRYGPFGLKVRNTANTTPEQSVTYLTQPFSTS